MSLPPPYYILLLPALLTAIFRPDRVEARLISVPELAANICGVQYREDPERSLSRSRSAGSNGSWRTAHESAQSRSGLRSGEGPPLEKWVCPKNATGNVIPMATARIFAHQPEVGLSIPLLEIKGLYQHDHVKRFVQRYQLDPKKPTLIYTGGWTQDHEARWLQDVRRNFDRWTQVSGGEQLANLIIFDWSTYAIFPDYVRSVVAVDHIAGALADFIGQLVDYFYFESSSFHVISYSLSTHIVGLAGRKLQQSGQGQLDQITAIDPTGICFHPGDGDFGANYGLQPSDAKLVVAAHHNMDVLGARRPIGDVDVFFNGGKKQPNTCHELEMNLTLDEKLVRTLWGGLDHLMAPEHETYDPLPEDCHRVAYHCESQAKFLMGQCGSCGPENQSCLMLGVIANLFHKQRPSRINYQPNTRMFISTGYFQFCIHHYQIIARIRSDADDDLLNAFATGFVKFQIDHHVVVKPMHKWNLSAGSNDSHLFTDLLRLDKSDLKFRKQIPVINPRVARSITSLEIYYMSSIFAEERARKSAHYCPLRDYGLVLC